MAKPGDTDEVRELRRQIEELRAENQRLAQSAAGDADLSHTELAHQAQILESILASSGEGVVVADMNGRFVVFNPAAEEILQLGSTDSRTEAWSATYGLYRPDGVTVFPPDELPLARAIKGESSDEVEMVVRHARVAAGSPHPRHRAPRCSITTNRSAAASRSFATSRGRPASKSSSGKRRRWRRSDASPAA